MESETSFSNTDLNADSELFDLNSLNLSST